MRDYNLDRFEYQPLLDFLNNPKARPAEMRTRLLQYAEEAVGRSKSRLFLRNLGKCVNGVLGKDCKISATVPVTRFVGGAGNELSGQWRIHPRWPILEFKPIYAGYFYSFACLIANPSGMERFSKCGGCGKFFLQHGRLRRGRSFCSDDCREKFHARQPKPNNAANVREWRKYNHLFDFIQLFWGANPRDRSSWEDRMRLWNEEGAGRSKANQYKDPKKFEDDCIYAEGPLKNGVRSRRRRR